MFLEGLEDDSKKSKHVTIV